jgi:soluble lytic murein transglycosylase-like protein
MIGRLNTLVSAFILALFATPDAHAEVFEMSADGNLVNITQPKWQPEPVVSELPMVARVAPAAMPTETPETVSVQQHIQTTAARYGINGALLDALAWQESRYNHRARSSAGAIGIMQLMPGTARSLGVTDPTNISQNVAGGAAYLRAQLEQFGNNVPLALAAYNAGPGAVMRYGGIPPYRETQNYVRQIMNRMARTSSAFDPN